LRNIRERMQLLYKRDDLLKINMGKIEFEAVLKIPKRAYHE
jgi:hypothetical protein